MAPNYFRWIKTADSIVQWDGYTLEFNEPYETGFYAFTTAPAYSDLKHDDSFQGAGSLDSGWGIFASAPAYSDLKHDENFTTNNSDLDAGWPDADASA